MNESYFSQNFFELSLGAGTQGYLTLFELVLYK